MGKLSNIDERVFRVYEYGTQEHRLPHPIGEEGHTYDRSYCAPNGGSIGFFKYVHTISRYELSSPVTMSNSTKGGECSFSVPVYEELVGGTFIPDISDQLVHNPKFKEIVTNIVTRKKDYLIVFDNAKQESDTVYFEDGYSYWHFHFWITGVEVDSDLLQYKFTGHTTHYLSKYNYAHVTLSGLASHLTNYEYSVGKFTSKQSRVFTLGEQYYKSPQARDFMLSTLPILCGCAKVVTPTQSDWIPLTIQRKPIGFKFNPNMRPADKDPNMFLEHTNEAIKPRIDQSTVVPNNIYGHGGEIATPTNKYMLGQGGVSSNAIRLSDFTEKFEFEIPMTDTFFDMTEKVYGGTTKQVFMPMFSLGGHDVTVVNVENPYEYVYKGYYLYTDKVDFIDYNDPTIKDDGIMYKQGSLRFTRLPHIYTDTKYFHETNTKFDILGGKYYRSVVTTDLNQEIVETNYNDPTHDGTPMSYCGSHQEEPTYPVGINKTKIIDEQLPNVENISYTEQVKILQKKAESEYNNNRTDYMNITWRCPVEYEGKVLIGDVVKMTIIDITTEPQYFQVTDYVATLDNSSFQLEWDYVCKKLEPSDPIIQVALRNGGIVNPSRAKRNVGLAIQNNTVSKKSLRVEYIDGRECLYHGDVLQSIDGIPVPEPLFTPEQKLENKLRTRAKRISQHRLLKQGVPEQEVFNIKI